MRIVEYEGKKGYVPRNYLALLNEEKNEEKNEEVKNGEKDDKTSPKASVILPSSSTIRRESRALFDSINQSTSTDRVLSWGFLYIYRDFNTQRAHMKATEKYRNTEIHLNIFNWKLKRSRGRVRASTDSAKIATKPLPSLPIKRNGEGTYICCNHRFTSVGPGSQSSQGKGWCIRESIYTLNSLRDVSDYSIKLFEALTKLESSTPQTLGEDIRRVRRKS